MKNTIRQLTGYHSKYYVDAVRGNAELVYLHRSEGYLIAKTIFNSEFKDASNIYPLFMCKNWNGLREDLNEIDDKFISVTIVTDPFGEFDRDLLQSCFPYIVKPFKTHYILDFKKPFFIKSNHRRNIKKARKLLDVEFHTTPINIGKSWVRLYQYLCEKHGISGAAKFNSESLLRQLEVPGCIAWSASFRGEIVGITLWMTYNEYAYYHLGAFDHMGYLYRASFVLFAEAIRYFGSQNYHAIDFGSGPGLHDDQTSGLVRFKKGWSNASRPVYLCGRVGNRELYKTMSEGLAFSDQQYFPDYRAIRFRKVK